MYHFIIYLISKNATNEKCLFKVLYKLVLAGLGKPCAGGFKDRVGGMESR